MPATRKKSKGESDSALVLAALDSMPLGVVVLDRDCRVVAYSTKFLEIHGFSAEEIHPGTPLGEMIERSVALGNHPGRTPEELTQELYARFAKGHDERRVAVYERATRDGRSLRITSTPLPDGAWIITHEDVSEVKRYVDALRERDEEITRQNTTFDFAMRNMRQGMCMYDADSKLVYSNPQYADMYNIPRDRIRPGMSLMQVLDERFAAGNRPIGGRDAFHNNRVSVFGENAPAAFVVEMEDGRAISILHQPLKGGGWVATHWEVTEERRNEARIRHLARHDALTDLPNRILLREHMEDLEARAACGEVMAVLCVDLDHFKTVNDTLGHAIGDEVLKEVAARLLANVRESDVCARLGGDEFAILHGPLRSPQEASALAGRIVEAISEPFRVLDHQVIIGASVGIAVAPNDGCDPEALLKGGGPCLLPREAWRARHISFLREEHGCRGAPAAPAGAGIARGARRRPAQPRLPAVLRPQEEPHLGRRGAAPVEPSREWATSPPTSSSRWPRIRALSAR